MEKLISEFKFNSLALFLQYSLKMYGKYTSDIKEFIKNTNRIKKELEGLQG